MTKPLTTDELRNKITIILWPQRSNPSYTFLTDEEKKLVDPIMAAVKDHVDWVIGVDSTPDGFDPDFVTSNDIEDIKLEGQNELRAQQRNRGGAY